MGQPEAACLANALFFGTLLAEPCPPPGSAAPDDLVVETRDG